MLKIVNHFHFALFEFFKDPIVIVEDLFMVEGDGERYFAILIPVLMFF